MFLAGAHHRFTVIATAVLIGGLAGGCQRSAPQLESQAAAEASATLYETEIRPAPAPRGVATATLDGRGQAVRLPCQSCHSVRPADVTTARSSDLDTFHQGLSMAHGKLTCVSCHNPGDGYQTLRLADGQAIAFSESMTLCAQCHGTQFRDYQHGAHGGMRGYWNLTQGGRTRNHCLHCHDPHAPKYPVFMPAVGPRDRFPPASTGDAHD